MAMWMQFRNIVYTIDIDDILYLTKDLTEEQKQRLEDLYEELSK